MRAVIASLRVQLREARAAKKTRMRELVEQCRREQKALGQRLREKRTRTLTKLRESANAARTTARAAYRQRKEDAKQKSASVIAAVRRDLDAERKREAELRRIQREELAGRAKCACTHETDAQVRMQLPSEFRLLFDRVKHAIRPRPGTSRAQTFLQFAAAHPGDLFAAVEPKQAKALAEAAVTLANVERGLAAGDVPSASELKRAERIARLSGRPAKRSEKANGGRARGQRIGNEERGDWMPAGYNDRVLCSRCGIRGGQHRGSDGKCPATDGYGRLTPDPMSLDWTLEGEKLREAMDAYWSVNGTFYRAMNSREPDERVPPPPAAPPPAAMDGLEPNTYELKKNARIERMRARADKKRAKAEAALASGRRIGDAIPMGQPILLGHHSQKRHERDIERMRGSFDKYTELSNEAKALTRRADHAERNAAVSSDDPNAILKLRAKLAEEEAERVRMHAANAALRAGGDIVSALRVLGFSDDRIATLRERRNLGEAGFQHFHMRNSSQEIARLKKRIAHLEAQATKPAPSEETIGAARISETDNRVRIAFPGVPPEATRHALKSEGFRWAPSMGVWQRHASNAAWHAARRALAHDAGAP